MFLRSARGDTKPLFLLFCDFFFDFLPSNNDVKVHSKSNMQKNFFKIISFLSASWSSMMKIDPDPLVRGMDPRIRIHTKMSWIRNSGLGPYYAGVDYNLTLCPLQHMYHGHWATLCQSRLYPRSQGLRIWSLGTRAWIVFKNSAMFDTYRQMG